MENKEIDNAVNHITTLQENLCQCENNLQYIKRLQALKYWIIKFDELLENKLQKEYAAIYESYFCSGCGFSFYGRVCNSILEYNYGNRPF